MNNYVTGKKASEMLGVHQQTLYSWEKKGLLDTIRTPGNRRMYNVEKYLKETEKHSKYISEQIKINPTKINPTKLNIIYARVSSLGQKDDLERQKKLLVNTYPNHVLIEDIGSGINMNRRGLLKIIESAIDGKINEVVVVHKDRLSRFGFELIKHLIEKYSKGKIIIINKEDKKEPKEELVEDVLQIMNIFVAKMNGMRKYEKKTKNTDKKIENE